MSIFPLNFGRCIGFATIAAGAFGLWNSLALAGRPKLQVADSDLPAAELLLDQITVLSPRVQPEEAARLAECLYNTTRQLRREYQVMWPPLFNNALINSGIKKRGLCFQWAEDLLARLDGLKLRSLELHWGESEAGTWHENNGIVITAAGQPFSSGILVDCWRNSGRVYWNRVARDRFVWSENKTYAQLVRARTAAEASHGGESPPKIERQKHASGSLAKVSVKVP